MSIVEKEEEGKHPCEEPSGAEVINAGGHPFSEGAEVVLNFTTSDEVGNLVAAGGGSKEVQVDLPPGFVGNPQNVPECPLKLLLNNRCPANTAVGYTQASFASGNIEVGTGRADPFNVTPAERSRNTPAWCTTCSRAWVPRAIRLRADQKRALPARRRTSAATETTVSPSAMAPSGKSRWAAARRSASSARTVAGREASRCNKASEAPANAKPFLTNPTECSATAPAWNVRVNTWDEPANHQSKATSTSQPTAAKIVFRTPARIQAEPGLGRRHLPGR